MDPEILARLGQDPRATQMDPAIVRAALAKLFGRSQEDEGLQQFPAGALPLAFVPVASTGVDAYDAIERAQEGKWGSAGLSALGAALPFITTVGAKKLAGEMADVGKLATRRAQEWLSQADEVPTSFAAMDMVAEPSNAERIKALTKYEAPEGRLLPGLEDLGEAIGWGTKGLDDVPQFDVPLYVPPQGLPASLKGRADNYATYNQLVPEVALGTEKGGHLYFDTEPVRQFFRANSEGGDDMFRSFMSNIAANSVASAADPMVRRGSASFVDLHNPGSVFGDVAPWKNKNGILIRDLPFRPEQVTEGLGTKVWSTSIAPYLQLLRDNPGMTLDDLLRQGLIDPWQAMKTRSFEQGLLGNAIPPTVDRHVIREIAGNPALNSVSRTEYAPAAEMVARAAEPFGMTGTAGQGAFWNGLSGRAAPEMTELSQDIPFSQLFDQYLVGTRQAIPESVIGTGDLLHEIASGRQRLLQRGW